MLGLARRVKARLLFASTSEVYGDPEVHPQKETYWGNVNPIGPRACYDEAKRVAEAMCYAYAQQVIIKSLSSSSSLIFKICNVSLLVNNQERVEVRIARIFNTFGPQMNINDGRVVSNFITQSLQNKSLTVKPPFLLLLG